MFKSARLLLILNGLSIACFGQTNQVLSLNGVTGYVAVPSSPTLQPASAITVEAWIFPTTDGVQNPEYIAKSDGATGDSQRTYELNWPDGEITFQLFLSSTYAVISAPAASNQWMHVAATYDSSLGLLQLYTNGVLAAVTSSNSGASLPLVGLTVRQTTQPLYFGVNLTVDETYGDDTFASGSMDEIRIWNVARSGIQIAENRFCRLSGTESNLMAYWNFDGTNAADLTTNGNNGVLEGGATVVPIDGLDAVHDGVCGPPYFDAASLSYSTATGFRQKILGPTGMTLAIETSTNLTIWSTLFVLPNFAGEFEFDDVDTIGVPQSFYKVVPQ